MAALLASCVLCPVDAITTTDDDDCDDDGDEDEDEDEDDDEDDAGHAADALVEATPVRVRVTPVVPYFSRHAPSLCCRAGRSVNATRRKSARPRVEFESSPRSASLSADIPTEGRFRPRPRPKSRSLRRASSESPRSSLVEFAKDGDDEDEDDAGSGGITALPMCAGNEASPCSRPCPCP